MDFLVENKEMIMALLGFIALELIPRIKPGWVPATKFIYDMFGKVVPDKVTDKKLK
jgi:hypothetical protein